MKNATHFIGILCLLLALVLACGCSTQEPAADTGNGAADGGPATDADLRIITEEFLPLSYAGVDGKPTGLSTEVVNGILTRLNQKAEIEIMPWSEGYNLALSGPRVALYSTGRTDEREDLFKWVGPIVAFDQTLYARKDSGIQITSLEKAKNAGLIGVVKDDARHQFLEENQFDNIATCSSDAECLRSLMAGTTDLWFGSSANLVDIAQKEGMDPSAFEAVYTVQTVPMYIAFSTDTPDSVIADW